MGDRHQLLDPAIVFQAAPAVVAAFVGDEAVLWSERDGMYYGLDEVGTRVWRLGTAGSTLETMHRALLDEYEVDSVQLWADLERVVSELVSLGLAVTRSAPSRET